MKSSLLGYVYKTLWDRTLASFHIFHQTLLSTWFLAGPNLVPEMDAIVHTIVTACPSFLSSWKTPVHPLKPQGGISYLKPSLTNLTEFITFPSVYFVYFCHCVFLSGLCEIFKVRERNLLVWAPASRWGLGSRSSLMSSGMNQGQLMQTLVLSLNL